MSNPLDTRSGRPPVIPVTAGAYKALKERARPRRPSGAPSAGPLCSSSRAPRAAPTTPWRRQEEILVAWLAFGAILYFGAAAPSRRSAPRRRTRAARSRPER